MIRFSLYSFLMAILLMLSGCSSEPTEPEFGKNGSGENIKDLKYLRGSYKVIKGNELLGDTVFLNVVPPSISLITGVNSRIAILNGGIRDGRFYFEGKVRNSDNSELHFICLEFNINTDSVIAGFITIDFSIVGRYGNSVQSIDKPVELKFCEAINYDSSNFVIIGHRGGGSIGGSFPEPENSLAIISLAELYGANAVEIDVQLTKDKVPVIYHDETLNKRIINSEFLTGKVSETYFKHLREFARLKNGEKIPTLREMLQYILYQTTIKAVWLDVKNAETIDSAISIQIEFQNKVPDNRTPLEIYIGLAYEETYNRYCANPLKDLSPALCELGMKETERSGALVWAPRWTLGTLNEEIVEMHGKGKKVFFWTVDEVNFMRELIRYDNVDGILSNFPQTVFYERFRKKND